MSQFDEKYWRDKRGIAQRKLSYIEKFLCSYNPQEGEITEIKVKLNSLPAILDSYNDSQDQLEINSIEPESHYDDREEFMLKYEFIAAKLGKIIENVGRPSPPTSVVSGNNSIQALQLPKLNLPIFDGTLKAWCQFKDLFTTLILDNDSVNNIQKFQYLLSSLKGEPKGLLQSLTISEVNFPIAWQLLLSRYDDNKIISAIHVKALLNLPYIKTGNSCEYRSLVNELVSNKRAVQSLQPKASLADLLLIESILERLKRADRQEWELKTSNDKYNTLGQLTDFIEAKARAHEVIEFRNDTPQRVTAHIENKGNKDKLTKSFATSTTVRKCSFCNANSHIIAGCREFEQLNVTEKRDFLKNKRLCFSCLLPDHIFSRCKAKCLVCNKSHHKILHIYGVEKGDTQHAVAGKSDQPGALSYATVRNAPSPNSNSLLPTARVNVVDKDGQLIEVRCLLDSGSQMSFISVSLIKRLRLPVIQNNISIHGISNSPAANVVNTCNVTVSSMHNGFCVDVNCAVLNSITDSVPCRPIRCNSWNIPRDVKLSDPEFHKPGKIDLLLGADVFFNVILGQPRKREGFPTLLNTHFGYVLAGTVPPTSIVQSNRVTSLLTRTDMLNNQLRKFWELEEITHIPQTKEDKFCEQHFTETTARSSDGKFIVRLPVRLQVDIGNTYDRAEKRMHFLERKFDANPKLHESYVNFMNEYIELGHMEECSSTPEPNEFFIPHHPVFKPSSSTTKLRVVFDGSALSSNNYSLNDILCVGPAVQEDLYSIVLRFRKHPIAMTGDIAKMYRMVIVDPRDRLYQKILWRPNANEQLKCYKLNTVTYGTSPASFLATRCLKQLAVDHEVEFPTASETISTDFYVDDYLGGANSIVEAKLLQEQLIHLLNTAGFQLRKWSSNEKDVLLNVEPSLREDLSTCKVIGEQSIQALGINWNPETDCFRFPFSVKTSGKLTKRSLLSIISSIFDPLGMLAPAVIKCKLLMQKLFSLKLNWDDNLPQFMLEEWSMINNNLPCLKDISVDRKILPFANPIRVELHGFSDASPHAYGACFYLKSMYSDGSVYVALITSKSRVAPLKVQSLPRLELCGALLLCRLLKKVLSSLRLAKLDQIYLWTDSTICLSWLHLPSTKLQTFVANRISEIQDDTEIGWWNHVPSAHNPADCITRGVYPNQLLHLNLWWNGPRFLQEGRFPSQDTSVNHENQSIVDLPDIKKQSKELSSHLTCCIVTSLESNLHDMLCKYSSLEKLKRVFSYVLRFVNNVRTSFDKRLLGPISVNEANDAFLVILKLTQRSEYSEEITCLKRGKEINHSSKLLPLHPFLDEHDLLRVGGRLENSNLAYENKHQIIIPPKHYVAEVIIRSEHNKLLHAGLQSVQASLRTKYWFPAGRNVIKKVLHSCVICFKTRSSNNSQLMAQLPASRVRPSYPFETTGVDFAGPVNLRLGSKRSKTVIKAYIALFVCFSTKAIHLELVSELTSAAFIAALKRFLARRGRCREIVSDNGRNFVGAAAELKRFFQQSESSLREFGLTEGFDWKFIPPRAPHFGGLWESNIKSVKAHLHKVIGQSILNFEDYYTLLCQIEACLNSRPLCPLSEDPTSLTILTPGHFLIGRPLMSFPDPSVLHIPIGRLNRWQHLQRMSQDFWKRWHSDYLNNLQMRQKWLSTKPNLKVNDLVLIKEDNVPPMCWKLGRVTELYNSSDNLCRVVKLRTSCGELTRPIVKLCPLPLEDNLENSF